MKSPNFVILSSTNLDICRKIRRENFWTVSYAFLFSIVLNTYELLLSFHCEEEIFFEKFTLI